MGYQFVHIEAVSRKGTAAKTGKDGVARGGRAGVAAVLAEASRAAGAAPHVDAPLPPVLVHGVLPDEVGHLHDQAVEVARCEVAGGKARKVRQDQATLLTVVASYPDTSAACAEDPDAAARRDEWQARTVAWLRDMHGDRLVSVVRHDDETHPHLHAYVLPGDPSMRANLLHPGWVAKQEAKASAVAAGDNDPAAVNKIGDRAYRQAMRGLQDSYWESVGLPCGLARVGPGRRRLSRDGWLAEQASVQHAAKAMRAAVDAEDRARDLAARGRAFVAQANAKAAAAEKAVEVARKEAAAAKADADAARQEAHRLGGLLGAVWGGLTGVRRRIEAAAEERIAAIKRQAKAAVQGARQEAQAVVAGEVATLRGQASTAQVVAARAQEEAKAARVAAKVAEGEAIRERARRENAERERDTFRARWADADNKLQAAHPRRRHP